MRIQPTAYKDNGFCYVQEFKLTLWQRVVLFFTGNFFVKIEDKLIQSKENPDIVATDGYFVGAFTKAPDLPEEPNIEEVDG